MRQDSWYQGSRSEIIAEYLLSNIAFTVPVVTRSDIGVDLFCTLYKIDTVTKNRKLIPTSMFAVQIKSKDNPIVLSEFNFDYLRTLEVPYFIGVVDRENQSLTIFSCQQFLQLTQKFGGLERSEKFEIELAPVEKYSEANKEHNLDKIIADKYGQFQDLLSDPENSLVEPSRTEEGVKRVTLEIGPKIIQIKADEINDKKVRNELTNKLSNWIALWYENNYKKETYVPFHELRFHEGETYIPWYNDYNYSREVYYRLSIRLAMLFIYYLNDAQRLRDHKEVIENSENLVRLTLSKIDENSFYYKKLNETFNRAMEIIRNLPD